MSRRVWKAVETKAEKTGVVEVAREREKKRRRKEMRGNRIREEKEEEKTKERKNDGSKKYSRRMRNLGWGGRSSKI